ncbi:MAG: hypothetical protein EA352_04545, partial [Gemmatimonadales bacterium]
MNARSLPLALLTFLVLGAPLSAQQEDPERMSRQEMQQRIMAQFDRQVQRDLELSDSELSSVREISVKFYGYRVEVMRDRRMLQRSMERFMEQGGSEMEARRILRQLRAFRDREASIEDQERDALLEVLSHAQLLRLHMLREEFRERIRNVEGRRGPPGGSSGSSGGSGLGQGLRG